VHGLSLLEVDEFLAELAALLEPVDIHFLWRPQLTDAKDEMVLEAAVNGHADALVTHNVSDFYAAGERFGIPILRPSELMDKVKR
jgi:predicted nucleic acid-binding protein